MPDVLLPSIPDKFLLTPEFKLLAACSWIAPPALEQDQAEKIASLCRGGIDWKGFIALVGRHGVPVLAYTVLCRYAVEWLPDVIRETMKIQNIQVAGQSLRQSAELVRLSKLFAEHSIAMIVMKGVLLSLQLYESPTVRASTDIDLLVSMENFDHADELICAAGYRRYFPCSMLTETQKNYHRATGQNYEYVHDSSGLKLELHWRCNLWTNEQTEVFWGRCRSVSWMGQDFNVWDDDALLLSLCYHGAHHEWCSFKWLSDVAALLSQDRNGGWDSLLALAEQLGMRRVLAQSALLVLWLYRFPLPERLCVLIHEEKTSLRLSTTAVRALLSNSGELAAVGKRLDGLRHSWYMIRLVPTLSYAEILKSIVIKDIDFKRFPLPNSLFWLYVPLRPFFWFWRNYIKPDSSINDGKG